MDQKGWTDPTAVRSIFWLKHLLSCRVAFLGLHVWKTSSKLNIWTSIVYSQFLQPLFRRSHVPTCCHCDTRASCTTHSSRSSCRGWTSSSAPPPSLGGRRFGLEDEPLSLARGKRGEHPRSEEDPALGALGRRIRNLTMCFRGSGPGARPVMWDFPGWVRSPNLVTSFICLISSRLPGVSKSERANESTRRSPFPELDLPPHVIKLQLRVQQSRGYS